MMNNNTGRFFRWSTVV